MGRSLSIGKRYRWQVDYQETLRLERKHTIIKEYGQNKNELCSIINYDDCILHRIVHLMKTNSRANCTVPWVERNENICTNSRDINQTFAIWWNRITNQMKDCNVPCQTMLINISPSIDEEKCDKLHGILNVYFSPRIIQNEEHYLYSYLKLIAEVGAYLGIYRLILWLLSLCHFKNLTKERETLYKTSPNIVTNVENTSRN